MTDQQHPITPPPELIKDWHDEWNESDQIVHSAYTHIAIRAAQWGSDQELDACCEWLAIHFAGVEKILRAARRPKPPSLKRVALLQLDVITKDLTMHGLGCDLSQIRRALESIPDHTSEGGFNG